MAVGLDDGTGTSAERHAQRREKFSSMAGERLRAAEDCQFSFLPYEELARVAGGWYEACAQAMLRGNYADIDTLIRKQARVAAEQGFALEDLLQLLRLCRRTAIEVEGWNEDQFADVDAVIDEALGYLRQQVPWDIPEALNYLTGKGRAAEAPPPEPVSVVEEPRGERRIHRRNRLRLPIRVHGTLSTGEVDEVTYTENVARGGVYFVSPNAFYPGITVTVTYPYWEDHGAINKQYPASVVRIDPRGEDKRGVALKFQVTLERTTG